MSTTLIHKAVQYLTCFVAREEKEVFLNISLIPNNELAGVLVLLNGVKIFPLTTNEGFIPTAPIKLGTTSTIKDKELIINTFIQDDSNDFSNASATKIEITGLLFQCDLALYQSNEDITDGSKAIYRIEVKFF